MRIRGFRILDYRSIRDSSYCALASDLTLLAGKNESGKTAILEALSLCGTTPSKLEDDAIPVTGETPSIQIVYDFTQEEMDEAVTALEPLDEKAFRKQLVDSGVRITFSSTGTWKLDGWVCEYLARELSDHNRPIIEELRRSHSSITKNLASPPATTAFAWDDDPDTLAKSLKTWSESALSSSIPTAKETVQKDVLAFQETIKNLWLGDGSSDLEEIIKKDMPRHVLYSSFNDTIPFSIPIAQAESNESVRDFATLAKLDLKQFAKMDKLQQRVNLAQKCSAEVNGEFCDYWKQGEVKLTARPDGDKLCIAVKDSPEGAEFQMVQRSKGFQWFLSFYLRIRARATPGDLILIDEPGLYLHAKAQKDVLRVLENLSKDHQIIFSTHSPYLIDASRLDRVRLVEKSNNEGTRITTNLSKHADAETLTPIMTAIGLNLGDGFHLTRPRNLVVEGASDYYYLRAFADLTGYKLPDNVGIIPCTGATRVTDIVSILIGWGLEYRVLFDSDAEGKRAARQLEKEAVDKDSIVFVPANSSAAIEDMFSIGDFHKYVLNETEECKTEQPSNSQLVKTERMGKAILARQFFDSARGDNPPEVSKESLKSMRLLLQTAFGPWSGDVS